MLCTGAQIYWKYIPNSKSTPPYFFGLSVACGTGERGSQQAEGPTWHTWCWGSCAGGGGSVECQSRSHGGRINKPNCEIYCCDRVRGIIGSTRVLSWRLGWGARGSEQDRAALCCRGARLGGEWGCMVRAGEGDSNQMLTLEFSRL